MTEDAERWAAHVQAYQLLQAVQGEDRHAALGALPVALDDAKRRAWPDVAFVLKAAQVIDLVNHGADSPRTGAAVAALVDQAADAGGSAFLAMALGLRAVAAAGAGSMATLVCDAARAVALLDDDDQSALDRCVGYVVTAAAFNALRLWELADDLYSKALAFGPDSRIARQTASVAVNRVLSRLEWALAVLELGDNEQADLLLARVCDAVPAALAEPMPALWHRDVVACADIATMLRGVEVEACLSRVEEHRRSLVKGGDLEVLPVLEAAEALALWNLGRYEEAREAAGRLSLETSVSSGAHSFPLWVRAKVLAEADPSAATSAQSDYSREICQLLWQSRLAVLAASRAQILIERRRREHDALSRAVDTDPLTGLHNRRMFESWLLRPSPDAGTNTALLLVDVDDFKEVNDTFGHDCGDQVLRTVANLMASSIRAGDIAIRHGGDEFALLMEGDHLLNATVEERAEQLIAAISAAPWSDIASGLVVSVSIGVGLSARASAAELYKIADAALYRAKRARSRVALAHG